jgi:hypothetical protein
VIDLVSGERIFNAKRSPSLPRIAHFPPNEVHPPQVSSGGGVYAIPQDSGPMACYYRKDILDKYHLIPDSGDQCG